MSTKIHRDMIHLDIKKFGKFDRPGHRVPGDRRGQSNPRARKQGSYGWEYMHVCVDDASYIAFTDIHRDEKKESAVAFLKPAAGRTAGALREMRNAGEAEP